MTETTIKDELEAALTRVAELEAMFKNGVPSYRRALDQRDYAVGALKERDRIWCKALRDVLDSEAAESVRERFIDIRDKVGPRA